MVFGRMGKGGDMIGISKDAPDEAKTGGRREI